MNQQDMLFLLEEEDVTMGDIHAPEDGDVEVLCVCGKDYFQN